MRPYHPMRTLRSTVLTAGLLLLLPLGGCSTESGSREFDGDLYVLSCSLGCTNGQDGEQVFCSIVNTFQNQEIAILFSEPIDLFSVNSSSFRVVNVANGTSPPGQFFGDPLNPRRLIFRPALSFNENGTPIFGFQSDTSYEITIPGKAQGDSPPFIQSVSGRENLSRLQCTIFTSEGVIDPVPGAPTVQVFVDVVTSYDVNGNPDGFAEDVLVVDNPEVTEVWRESPITFFFDDIMNVATLVDPSTGNAPFLKVEVDNDGNLSTLGDRSPVEGNYTFSVDQERLETTLVFRGDLPFPTAGPDAPANPRRIAVTIPDQVQDLVANTVEGGGTLAFVPELSQFGEITLPDGGEDFINSTNEDVGRSGAFWGSGSLRPGVGGGSGRLGDLIVPNGIEVTLNTDQQTFPLTVADGYVVNTIADVMGNPDAVLFPDTVGNFPDEITVTDGVFEFHSLIVEAGGALRLVGTNPARIYVRGPARVEASGIINLSGATPEHHDSLTENPDAEVATPINAANGADGGFGGDRYDMAGVNPNMGQLGGESDAIENPNDRPNGYPGMGVGREGFKGGGIGGAKHPTRYPTLNTLTVPEDNNDHGVTFNQVDDFDLVNSQTQCRSLTVGGSGGGGSYATLGGFGVSQSTQPLADYPDGASNSGPNTPPGDNSSLNIEAPAEDNLGYDVRLLEWQKGNLRGGSGGGGGGNSPYGTQSWCPIECIDQPGECIGPDSFFLAWHDHSGARGGFGGGALHLVSGSRIVVAGEIDARGGRGGRARQAIPQPGDAWDWGQHAMPGGGGSGGAVKLQSRTVELGAEDGRIDVSGGPGGGDPNVDEDWSPSVGGSGGTGLVRIEDTSGQAERALLAPFIAPFEPLDDSLGWVSVDNGTNPADGPGWVTPLHRPGAITGSSSCWLFPPGNFFALQFTEDEDDPVMGDPAKMGWNMDVLYRPTPNDPVQVIPFRGLTDQNPPFAESWESLWGINLGTDGGTVDAAPIVVRFQGARATGNVDRCNLDLNENGNGLQAGSVTPWVSHPALLNDFNPPPNMIRFVILFDATRAAGDSPGDILATVTGVTGLAIRALPE